MPTGEAENSNRVANNISAEMAQPWKNPSNRKTSQEPSPKPLADGDGESHRQYFSSSQIAQVCPKLQQHSCRKPAKGNRD
jgi:hypothetical protein